MQVDFESFYEQHHLKYLGVEEVNTIIKKNELKTNEISDGYHTFGELYEHRITLFIILCRLITKYRVWRSKKHHDGSEYDGWFIMGIGTNPGYQISYHLPLSKWEETNFVETLDFAPEWDGHTSGDVLVRLRQL